jgi:NodT family efflux transporter outer membrane factor (OMF) lipoprotein
MRPVTLQKRSIGAGRRSFVARAAAVRAAGRTRPVATAVALAALLAGCASYQQPSERPAVPVPAQWTSSAAAVEPDALAYWWQRFGDAELAALVGEALRLNTSVAAAQARLRAARAQRDLAASALQPGMAASAGGQASAREGLPSSRAVTAGLDARWEPDLWGGTRAGVDAAEADLRASAATLAGTQVQVAAEVALAYLELRGTQARLATGLANLESQRQTLQITQWRAQAGLVTQLDVEQARTAVEQTRAQVPVLEGAIVRTIDAIAVLTGQPPGALQSRLAPPTPLPAAPADLALAFPADVLRQRPDIASAEARVHAARARIEQADAQRLPSLSLGGSIGLSALTLSALGSGAGVASIAASVAVPVFDGGRIEAQVRTQEAGLDEAHAAYRATVLAALQEVEAALVSLRAAREQLAGQQAAAESARRAAQLADFRYRSGLIDFQAVLQTQRTLLALEDAATATATEVVAQHVRLYKALGGGWSPDGERLATSSTTTR